MNYLFRTVTHPAGWGGFADYEIRDGKLYRAATHPDGGSGLPDYEIRNDEKVYRQLQTLFEMQENSTDSPVQVKSDRTLQHSLS